MLFAELFYSNEISGHDPLRFTTVGLMPTIWAGLGRSQKKNAWPSRPILYRSNKYMHDRFMQASSSYLFIY